MKISISKSAGFCFGVKRAIGIALQAAGGKRKVYALGDIVHNETVSKEIAAAGVKKVARLLPGAKRAFLIRAHGVPLSRIKRARLLGYKIIDATCPMVKQIHRIVRRMENKGYKIIIIGDRRHDEVQGIKGQLKSGALVITGLSAIPLKKIKRIKKACVVAQSTQDTRQTAKIIGELKKYIPDLKSFDTICKATKIRQEEIARMPAQNDLMLVIGSRSSANTKRLYQISKSINKNSYWINSASEIKKGWFADAKRAGITAGASTPEETIRSILDYILKIRT